MPGYIIAGGLAAALLMFIIIKPKKAIYLKSLVLPLLGVFFILALILFSDTSVAAAARGIKLWLEIVFPSLFPFFVASEVLNATGFVRAAGVLLEPVMRPLFKVPGCGSFALAMGVSSGYPVGARITCSLLENGDITKTEAERLIAFTNNSGPLFIVGAVATGMYGIPSVGLFLLACHIAACLTVGILFRFYKPGVNHKNTRGKNPIKVRMEQSPTSTLKRFKKELFLSNKTVPNTGTVFGDAVRNSVSLIIMIGAFIIFFSVVINLLLKTNVIGFLADAAAFLLSPAGVSKSMLSAVLSGFFEITTGTSLASSAAGAAMAQKLIFTSLIIGWAGLSVHSQVYSIAGKAGISLKPYLFGKLLQGVIAAVYTWIGLQWEFVSVLTNQPVLSSGRIFAIGWQGVLLTSLKYLAFVLLVYALFYIGAFTVKRLRRQKKSR